MLPPRNIPEMRYFIGMTNQLSKFIPCSAEMMKPLTKLLSSKCSFRWGPNQSTAFDKIKETLTRPSIFILYDPVAETKVSADTSSFGLGAVILQQTGIMQPCMETCSIRFTYNDRYKSTLKRRHWPSHGPVKGL